MTLTACGQSAGDAATREALTAALSSAAAVRSEVTLATVVPGEWTRVLFVCPYGSEQDVTDRLGFVWDDYPGPDQTEGLATFVFATDSTVVTWTTLGRNVGDPCSGSTSLDTADKSAAVYSVVQTDTTGNGRPFYALMKKP